MPFQVRRVPIRFRRLTLDNFSEFESLTADESEGGCYCSFWHQKWSSMSDWEKCKKETPGNNRAIVLEKVRSGFHVGVLAYRGDDLAAWVSVGPLPDYYWTWRRVAQRGDAAKTVAGVLCITIRPILRRTGLQKELLYALKGYGKEEGWSSIEGYPFDPSAIERHGDKLSWPGLTKGFMDAGFVRTEPHWLSSPDAARSIYSCDL